MEGAPAPSHFWGVEPQRRVESYHERSGRTFQLFVGSIVRRVGLVVVVHVNSHSDGFPRLQYIE